MKQQAWILLAVALWLPGCQGAKDNKNPDAGTDVQGDTQNNGNNTNNLNNTNNVDPPLEVTELGEYVHTFQEGPRTFRLLRIGRKDGKNAYAMWSRVDRFSPSPAVVMAQPYDGIDWTGDPVDEKWALRAQNQPAAAYPDEDGPGYDPATSAPIGFSVTPLAQLAESSNIFILNGISPLLVFGRFYAGDDIAETVHVMHAGLRFLEENPDVDPARIGIYGGSWGGFMTVYGAAVAPAALHVSAAALFPPVDFGNMHHYVTEEMPQLAPAAHEPLFSAFFEPYVRRMLAGRGKLGGTADTWEQFTTADVCAGLRGDTLVLHDDWDTLVPFSQSRDLEQGCPGVHALYWTHDDPINWNTTSLTHGPIGDEPVFPSMYTFALGYLVSRLTPPSATRLLAWSRPAMVLFLTRVRILENRGESIASVADRLLEWIAPSTWMVDLAAGNWNLQVVDEALADVLSEVWEIPLAPAQVPDFLASRQ